MEYGSFLDGYIRLCRETEAPPIFGLWCGVSAVSAALGRNSYLQFGQFPIYPNFFIVIIGSSGLYRKSTSIEMADWMLKHLQPQPKLIAQKITPEALIQAVRRTETENMMALGKEMGTAHVVADEFQTFLNKKTYEAGLAALLIQMFDCKDQVSYETIGRGNETVHNSCLGILGGSTIDWLKGGIPEEAVGGGLTSRMIFIYYDGVVRDIPWPVFSVEQQELRGKLLEHLQRITQISGLFTLEAPARALYDEEYIRFRNTSGKDLFYDKDLRGYASRRHIHMLKLSMVLSASIRFDRIVTVDHIRGAIGALQECEKNLPLIISQITSTATGSSNDLVLSHIRKAGRITRTALQRAVAHRLDRKAMDDILDTLMIAGLIDLIHTGAAVSYQLRKDESK